MMLERTYTTTTFTWAGNARSAHAYLAKPPRHARIGYLSKLDPNGDEYFWEVTVISFDAQYSGSCSRLELGGIDAYINSKGCAFAIGLPSDAKERDGRRHPADLELALSFFYQKRLCDLSSDLRSMDRIEVEDLRKSIYFFFH
jgi:hypothetical protein